MNGIDGQAGCVQAGDHGKLRGVVGTELQTPLGGVPDGHLVAVMAVGDQAWAASEEAPVSFDSICVLEAEEPMAVAEGVLMFGQENAVVQVFDQQGVEATVVVAQEQDGFQVEAGGAQ